VVARSVPEQSLSSIPRHVAVIMDGNGRWARNRLLPRLAGHKAGIEPVRRTVEHCAGLGVRTLTLFAFSSENWQRPPAEVRGLMSLFLDALNREVAELDANGIRLKFIGNREQLSTALARATRQAERATAGNTGMQLVVAVAYGGRWDIVQAARALAEQVADGRLDPRDIDEERLAAALQTADLPGVDLLIRTGGERRVSNFLLWNIAYSEVYFSDVLWPDFTATELGRAFEFYARRQRRFGRTSEQIEAVNC
jgi:undecaprenyl diphosphate synthase